MTEKTVKIFPNMYFGLTHCYDEVPDNNDFKLHNHDDVYEIVLFLAVILNFTQREMCTN